MHKNTSAFSKIAMHKSIDFKILSSQDVKDMHSSWAVDIDQVLNLATSLTQKN